MSLFQCQHCGCAENTALAGQGCQGYIEDAYNWEGIEDRRGKMLCSACAPTKYASNTPTRYGKWHGQFPRYFLPMGMFKTNKEGNLEHVENGDTAYHHYAIVPFPEKRPRKEFP